MIVWQTTKKCILHYSMRSLTHWSRSNSRILAAQKTFSSPPSSKLRKSISPQKTKAVPFPSHARYGVRAVATGNESQRFMAKPCTPHLHCAACAVLQAANPQCTFLWVGLREGDLFLKKRSPSLVYAPCLQEEHFNDYFLKLSLRVTDRLNTRCSAVQSLLSRQK